MKLMRTVVIGLCLVVFGLGARAQDEDVQTFTLSQPAWRAEVGDVVTKTSEMVGSIKMTAVGPDGAVISEQEGPKEDREELVMRALQVSDGGRVTHALGYLSSWSRVEAEKDDSCLHGAFLYLSSGAARVIEGGGDLTSDAKEWLTDETLDADAGSGGRFVRSVYPAEPVAVGDEWIADTDAIIEEVLDGSDRMEIDPDATEIRVQLLEVDESVSPARVTLRFFGHVEVSGMNDERVGEVVIREGSGADLDAQVTVDGDGYVVEGEFSLSLGMEIEQQGVVVVAEASAEARIRQTFQLGGDFPDLPE